MGGRLDNSHPIDPPGVQALNAFLFAALLAGPADPRPDAAQTVAAAQEAVQALSSCQVKRSLDADQVGKSVEEAVADAFKTCEEKERLAIASVAAAQEAMGQPYDAAQLEALRLELRRLGQSIMSTALAGYRKQGWTPTPHDAPSGQPPPPKPDPAQ